MQVTLQLLVVAALASGAACAIVTNLLEVTVNSKKAGNGLTVNDPVPEDVANMISQLIGDGSGAASAANGAYTFKSGRTERNGKTINLHETIKQYYKGYKIFFSSIKRHNVAHLGEFLSGKLVTDLEQDDIPDLSDVEVDCEAKMQELERSYTAEGSAPMRIYHEQCETGIFIDPMTLTGRLAYWISFVVQQADGDTRRPQFVIDVVTDEVLHYVDAIAPITERAGTGPGGNNGSGYVWYGKDAPMFWVTHEDGARCSMETTDVIAIDLESWGWPEEDEPAPFTFDCFYHGYDTVNEAKSPLNDAIVYGQWSVDMFRQWYGFEVLNGKQLRMQVHLGVNYNNAIWDGIGSSYGDGSEYYYPFIVLDVAAHEAAHGFTEFNSGLIYANESGGMNEAFSDMAGAAVKLYVHGEEDFDHGKYYHKDGLPSRYMNDPTRDGRSIDHVDNYTVGHYVHRSSGIYNKAFYLIASSQGWTSRESFGLFVCANKFYWLPDETFQGGAEKVLLCAVEMGYEQQVVIDAFSQVGIPLDEITDPIEPPTPTRPTPAACERGYYWC